MPIRVWDAGTWKELRSWNPNEALAAIAFSQDGRMLASIGTADVVKLWELATGQELRDFRGHQSFLTSLAFSPDGKRLATSSADTTILIWEVWP